MTQIIEVIVSPAGQTKIETRGFSGSSCQEASQGLEQALGIRQAEKLTAEFYAPQTGQQQIQEGRTIITCAWTIRSVASATRPCTCDSTSGSKLRAVAGSAHQGSKPLKPG